jgi:histidinol-phosphate aminotransferase
MQYSGYAMGAGLLAPLPAAGSPAQSPAGAGRERIRLCFNENPYGPSPAVAKAIQRELSQLNRYADASAARQLAERIAAYERVPVEQVVLGEILGLLGLYLGSKGGPGGEFLYSTPGYLALVDAAARVGASAFPYR